jgi:signal transduction histidine kinase
MKPSKKKSLKVDVGIISSLGRNSIKDHTTAILELIKNSYDAGATIVDVEIMSNLETPYIRITDNGCGMTENDIDNYWLRIGYSEKINEKFVGRRRKTGEKGIGRLSADRLGSILEMRSRAPGNNNLSIEIDWDTFNQMGKNVEDIKFNFYDKGVKVRIPKLKEADPEPISGTELIIKNLRQVWIKPDFDDLYKQLSMFISPFDHQSDFNIRLSINEIGKYKEVRQSELGEYFEVKLDGTFNPLTNNLSYDIWERIPGSSKRIKNDNIEIPLSQLLTSSDGTIPLPENKIGPVRIVLLYYPRNEKTVLDSGFKLSELGKYLDENAGIKIYRDNVRVKPYGELDQPGGDWLNLGSRFAQNPAGRARPSHRIRPSQLIGAIFISRDYNPELYDSTSREGLIQGDNYRLLREYILGCIRLVEASSHQIFIKEQDLSTDDESIDRNLITVNKKLEIIRDNLNVISITLSKNKDAEIKNIGETVSTIVENITYTTESIESLESQTRLYRGLATVGIASAVFGHETQTQISQLLGAVHTAKDYLAQSPPQLSNSLLQIDIAIDASERVEAWGGFALDRIRRDKRDKNYQNLSYIISRIIEELRRAFVAIDIDIDETEIDESIESRIFQIDIESIILNLLTNAFTACKQVKQNRKVKVSLNKSIKNEKSGFNITVSDSGPGVNEKIRSIIWEPTFTTKTTKKGATEEGTGMGLAIIDGIVEEMNGTRNVSDALELGGAQFDIWLPIVP